MKKKGFLPKKDTEKDDQRDEYVTGRLTNVFLGKPKSLISTFLTSKPDFNHDRKFVSVSVKNQGIGDIVLFSQYLFSKVRNKIWFHKQEALKNLSDAKMKIIVEIHHWTLKGWG